STAGVADAEQRRKCAATHSSVGSRSSATGTATSCLPHGSPPQSQQNGRFDGSGASCTETALRGAAATGPGGGTASGPAGTAGALRRIPVATVPAPDARTEHADLPVDQAVRGRHARDRRLAAVARAQDRAGAAGGDEIEIRCHARPMGRPLRRGY